MTTIRLTNTKTRKKEVFAPINSENLRMYVCGPTVYDRAHLGNARPVIVFDVLFRLLRHVYGAGHVTYVRNFTDVDDKINAEAQRRKEAGDPRPLEELIRERTDETIRWYHEDMDALGALRPTAEPRATEYIGQMIAMITELIAKDHAYAAEGHVLFAVDSWKEHYGKLSGRTVDDMIAGARVEVAPYKRNPMDFVLWKPSSDDLPGWDSPWGRGRPGWHIECSAMSHELLGDSFDIHGGGIDLQFPHHENEIAQSMCAHPEADFAKVWMHNEMLQLEGKKMSKSLGNFFTVRDLLDQGWPGEVIRFVYLQTHYSKPMDWTEEKATQAEATLRKWRELTDAVSGADEPHNLVVDAMTDDLNTPMAITALHSLAKQCELTGVGGSHFKASAQLLGLLDPKLGQWTETDDETKKLIDRLINLRIEARNAKNFPLSDTIRYGLADAGVQIKDSPEGTKWFLSPVGINGPLHRAFKHFESTGDRQYLEQAVRDLNSIGVNVSYSDTTGLPKTSGWVEEVRVPLPIVKWLRRTVEAVEALK